MKILFMAEPYMGLHIPIIEEMKKQGHDVVFVTDEHLPFNWRSPYVRKRKKLQTGLKTLFTKAYKKYWQERTARQIELNDKYDMFFAINGCCLHPIFLNHLRQKSPDIKTLLYLWDNSDFYDYYHIAGLFDRVATYDLKDSEKYNVEFLSFYWIDDLGGCCKKKECPKQIHY